MKFVSASAVGVISCDSWWEAIATDVKAEEGYNIRVFFSPCTSIVRELNEYDYYDKQHV